MNNTNSLERTISKKMKEADPSLDIQGFDQKIVEIACQDFTNYLKFFWRLSEETNNYQVGEEFVKFYEKEPGEAESFLSVWTGMWLKKWKQRVKILLGNRTQNMTTADSKGVTVARPSHVLEHKQEMIELIVSTLIKNAEICGTQILAENMLKTEVGKIKNQEVKSKEQMLTILNSALRRARDASKNVGPLIFVKVDKGYYGAAT